MCLKPNNGGAFPMKLKFYFQVLYNFSHFSWSAHFILQYLQITLYNIWGKTVHCILYKKLKFIHSASSCAVPTRRHELQSKDHQTRNKGQNFFPASSSLLSACSWVSNWYVQMSAWILQYYVSRNPYGSRKQVITCR